MLKGSFCLCGLLGSYEVGLLFALRLVELGLVLTDNPESPIWLDSGPYLKIWT